MRRFALVVCLASSLFGVSFYAQQPAAPARVDFARDVKPIFAAHCIECHGPDKQMNGLRLDRRGDARRGGTETVLAPGSAETSKLYLRLLGPQYGMPMPKDGTITAPEIETIRNWIDQGMDWPDAESGEAPVAPADPAATRAIAALRAGNAGAVAAMMAADKALAARRGPAGSSPLMFAALYGDAATVTRMLDAGANPNATNDAGATALMWAAGDTATARVLVERGADVNARSADGRTPLLIAAGVPGGADLVRLLLDRGAKPNVSAAGTTPLSEAARNGDPNLLQLLIDRGAKVSEEDPLPLVAAIFARCDRCVDMLAARAPKPLLGAVMTLEAPPFGKGAATLDLLARGADAKVPHPLGHNALMLTAASDRIPVEAVRALIARGLDVNAPGPNGATALALARQHGATPVVDLLVQAGAIDASPAPAPAPAHAPADSARTALLRSLPLLQRSDVTFVRKTGCVSCHNNTFTAVTVAQARARRLPIDETIAATQRSRIGEYLESWRERAIQGHGIPGDADTVGYLLAGLAAERYAPDAATDAMARFMLWQQARDGSWHVLVHRPPIESSDVEVTVTAIRALRAYAAPPDQPRAAAAIARAERWLRTAPVFSNEDRVYKLLGLSALPDAKALVRAEARALLAQQRADGGWPQIPSLDSDAYATGQALVALAQSGVVAPASPAWRRGAAFLLKTQFADGSWLVRSRSIPFQPQFNAELPHGRDQFISAAGTNWAAQALLYALPKSGT